MRKIVLLFLFSLFLFGCTGEKNKPIVIPIIIDEAAAYPSQEPGTRPSVLKGYQELTPEQLSEGWIHLFDGLSTYGWNNEIQGSKLIVKKLGSSPVLIQENEGDTQSENFHRFFSVGFGFIIKEANVFGFSISESDFELRVKTIPDCCDYVLNKAGIESDFRKNFVTSALIRPKETQPLGESEWKPASENCKAVWTDDVLELTGGSGMVETVEEFGDFVLQLEYYTEAGINSGVFFRCIPGENMNGYECQIFNDPPAEDYEKFIGTDTGGIFRRQVGRNIGPKNGEWNHLTIAVRGPKIATWVNGIQASDWTDTRTESENPRHGLRLEPGTIQLQGHDPGTRILFRNMRITPL